jgi:hypothetical protein
MKVPPLPLRSVGLDDLRPHRTFPWLDDLLLRAHVVYEGQIGGERTYEPAALRLQNADEAFDHLRFHEDVVVEVEEVGGRRLFQ